MSSFFGNMLWMLQGAGEEIYKEGTKVVRHGQYSRNRECLEVFRRNHPKIHVCGAWDRPEYGRFFWYEDGRVQLQIYSNANSKPWQLFETLNQPKVLKTSEQFRVSAQVNDASWVEDSLGITRDSGNYDRWESAGEDWVLPSS